ncbi:hypothetical protein CBER1_03891 [Cercospora berteroae]|uniref:BTB domain-containing protein n=1 Tax=Cercospora berteroae TaxID=357750 RepID=A0A2S6C9V2_9PEZI|nr:hypothetical protein CBER1_03891 [Cercospora berteroae]
MDQSSIAECIGAVKSDRLITLNIGKVGALLSVQVQQAVLEAASPWFQKALGDDRFVEGQSGVIAFPEDDTESWKILLYWLLHRDVPMMEDDATWKDYLNTLVKCWVLGDKYSVSKFQDEIMLLLIQYAYWSRASLQPAEYKKLIEITPADSHLMRLLGEEVAVKYRKLSNLTREVANVLDGVEGFWPAFLEAQHGLMWKKCIFDDRLRGVDSNGLTTSHWQEYMVGELPSFEGCIGDRV